MKAIKKVFSTILVLLFLVITSCTIQKNKVVIDKQTESIKKERAFYMPSKTRLSDIQHMKLLVDLNWDSCFVNGTAILTVKPYFHETEQLILDAKGFDIKSIFLNNQIAKYQYDQRKLTIQLDKKYNRNQSYTIKIIYVAKPNILKVDGAASISSDKGFYFINADNKDLIKPRQFWTQGETEANSCWFPTIESCNEKYTQEIGITVENKFVTLSNGRLVYSTQNSNGTRTDYWQQDLPHAPYLTMIAGGDFVVSKDNWKNMEVNYYMEPKYAPYAKVIFGNTPEMIEFFSKKTGVDYPWDKFSQIVLRDFVSGAMENTTAVSFQDDMNMTDRDHIDNTNEETIAHELFHHWFGDLTTSESWPNLPLNEGFATYGEYLWNEYKYGRDIADRAGQADLMRYLLSTRQEQVDMIRYHVEDREEMFDSNSYEKGGRILHMLRKYLGDDAFFTGINLFLETNKFKPVEIHQLRLAFEEVSGEDLNWFFDEWYLASGHPELNISYHFDEQNRKSIVKIAQVQNTSKTPIYKIPMVIDIYAEGKVERKKIIFEKLEQQFEFNTNAKPDLINVDAEKMLICTKKDLHSKEEWIFQYKNAPLYLDRMEALTGLDSYLSEENIQSVFISALTDKNYAIRITALSKIHNFSSANKTKLYNQVAQMAIRDNKSAVRTKAIRILEDVYFDRDNSSTFEISINDSSWSVASSTLKAFTRTNKVKAFQIAKENEKCENSQMIAAIGELYAESGTSENHQFFLNYFKRTTGYGPLLVYPFYKIYLKRMNDQTIKEGVDVIKTLASNATITIIESSTKSILADMLSYAKSDELRLYIKNAMSEIDKTNK